MKIVGLLENLTVIHVGQWGYGLGLVLLSSSSTLALIH